MQKLKKQKGITLIALIITIIVMLILVGVTINVALNGGLFEKGEKAAFQTGASTVKEQLEMAKALKVMSAKGKPVDDYSDITVAILEGLDDQTKAKYGNILVVNKNGDICYNPESLTDQEKEWLEEIGINAYLNEPDGNTTSEIWQERGLTGSNIKYDTLYYGQELDFKNDKPADRTLSVGLYSNGDFCLELDGAKPTSKLNSSGDGNYLGTNGVLSDEVDYYMSLGGFAMCDNGFTMPVSGIYFRYSFTNSNTVNIYIGTAEDLDEDGNVPETEEFFGGTLYELDL